MKKKEKILVCENIPRRTGSIDTFCPFRSYLLILILFSFGTKIPAQNYKEFETGFSTIFSSRNTIDSYHFGSNPAFLNFYPEDEFLSFKNKSTSNEGAFKKFITPTIDRAYQFFTSGKKSIDSIQKFKGSFGFSKLERKNWDWFFTRDYETDNPFIIGDSTTGNSRINGILLNAQYAINISNDFSAGVNLDYSVDEGLKTVSPRPTSEHRDIGANIGLGYKINKELVVGLTAAFSDKNEQISYREDEGALTQETIILKFKGYDFPNVMRKKVETRYSFTNKYATGITISYNDASNFSAAGYINSGFEINSIKDDALDPKGEGFWKDEYLEAGIKLKADVANGINSGLTYNYILNDGWAKYPPTDVLYYERKSFTHSLIAGIEKILGNDLSAGIESGISFSSREEDDYYSVVKSSIKFYQWFGKMGINYRWTEHIATLFSYGFSKKANSNNELYHSNSSLFFTNNRIYDLLYLQTGFVKHSFSVTSEISGSESNAFFFQINYSMVKPESGSLFGNNNRKEFEFAFEYRVKVI
ncbi:MAG: hypothetical protein Q8N83_13385 [Ignavibacteria bacterium]|nr:hypothetical protein [Ignavibacteria bacterium]